MSSGDEYDDLYISDEPQEISAPQEISERPDVLEGKEFEARDPFKHQQENVVASDHSCHGYNARSGPGYSGEKDNSKADTATCVQCGRESSVAGKQRVLSICVRGRFPYSTLQDCSNPSPKVFKPKLSVRAIR